MYAVFWLLQWVSISYLLEHAEISILFVAIRKYDNFPQSLNVKAVGIPGGCTADCCDYSTLTHVQKNSDMENTVKAINLSNVIWRCQKKTRPWYFKSVEFKSFIHLKLNVNIYFLLARIGKCHILLSGGLHAFCEVCGCCADEKIAFKLRLHAKDWLLQPKKKNFLFRLEAKMTRVGVGRWLLSNIWVAKLICVDVGLYIYTCVCAHTCVYVRVYFQNITLARQERNGEKGLFFSVLLFVAHSPLTFCTELPFCSTPVSTLTRQGLISLGW